MRLEGESSDEAGGAMQSWRDGDRRTDSQRGGREPARRRQRCGPGPPARPWPPPTLALTFWVTEHRRPLLCASTCPSVTRGAWTA